MGVVPEDELNGGWYWPSPQGVLEEEKTGLLAALDTLGLQVLASHEREWGDVLAVT